MTSWFQEVPGRVKSHRATEITSEIDKNIRIALDSQCELVNEIYACTQHANLVENILFLNGYYWFD